MIWVASNAGLIVGILVEFFSGPLGVLVASTGVGTGALRALAILRRSSTDQVERMTAIGFLAGAVFGGLVLVLDLILR